MIIHYACYQDGRLLHMVAEEYSGPWAECKETKEQKQQRELDNKMAAQQFALQQEALNEQKLFNQPVRENLTKYLSGDIGFTPEQMALLNSQFLNKQSQGFNEAGGQVFNALRARGFMGGDMPASGDAARNLSSLYGLEAASTSAGLTDIQLQNIQQALANKFNTAGIFAGVGGNYGQQSVGTGGIGANLLGSGSQIAASERPGISYASDLIGNISKLISPIGGLAGIGKKG